MIGAGGSAGKFFSRYSLNELALTQTVPEPQPSQATRPACTAACRNRESCEPIGSVSPSTWSADPRFGSPRSPFPSRGEPKAEAVGRVVAAPVPRRLRQPPKQPKERRRVPASNLEVRPPAAVPLLHNRRPDPRRTPKHVHISSNENVFTWGRPSLSRVFSQQTRECPTPAGLRSERSASIIRTKGLFRGYANFAKAPRAGLHNHAAETGGGKSPLP